MATYTISSAGVTSAQALPAASSLLTITGAFTGEIGVEVSKAGTAFAPLTVWPGTKLQPQMAVECRIPSGYSVRLRTSGGLGDVPALVIDLD
jgi:hypothetical protein